MKIAFVTICDNGNFGTYLQIYATQQILKHLNHHSVLVKYYRPVISLKSILLRKIQKRNSFVKKAFSIIFAFYEFLRFRKNGEFFFKKYVQTTRRYDSFSSLQKDPPMADLYLTGSDQVWNSQYNGGVDPVMFLEFAPDEKQRVAYSASFGMSDIPENEKEETLRYLKKYSHIGVREFQAMELLAQIGIKNTEHVLDPTLLLNQQDYSDILKGSKLKIPHNYVLIYSVEFNKDDALMRIAKTISQGKKKIVFISPYGFRKPIKDCDLQYGFGSVCDFLMLIKHADFVVCSSFHGTVFSLLFEKQFFSLAPDRFNSRTYSLLKSCGLLDRLVIADSFEDAPFNKEIVYDEVRLILEKQREKSLSFLKNALNVSPKK